MSVARLPALALIAACAGCAPTVNSAVSPQTFSTRSAYAETPASAAVNGLELSGFIGSELASRLSEREQAIAAEAQSRALDAAGPGEVIRWRSPSSDATGEVAAGPVYQVNVQRCRDFAHSVSVSGDVTVMRNVACRGDGGSWQLLG